MAINTGSIFAWVVCAASVFASGCNMRPPASQAAETLSCGAERFVSRQRLYSHRPRLREDRRLLRLQWVVGLAAHSRGL